MKSSWTDKPLLWSLDEGGSTHLWNDGLRNIILVLKLKKRVKQSHYTPWRRLGGEDVYLLLIHDLGTRWGWVVSVTPRPRFTPGERTPGTHSTGGWVDPRAGLDTEDTGKILCSRRGSNPDRPVVQPVVRHYTAWANPAPTILVLLKVM
jgi:hypothetical protein